MNLRERKEAEREARIAARVKAAGGVARINQACANTRLDAVAAPGGGAWKAPEPPTGYLVAPEGKGE